MLNLKRNLFYLFICLNLLITINGCKKEGDATVSTTPQIEFISVNKTTIQEFNDTLLITLKYIDGDADLGENNADIKNLFVTDSRNGITTAYRLQQLAPSGSSIVIKGQLTVQLEKIIITDNSSSQNATFNVYINDRAGHVSNTITTSAITITK